MKFLFTVDSLAQGGTEQSLAELIPHFGEDIEVIVVYFYDSHQLRSLFESLHIKLIYLDIKEKYGFCTAIKKFYKLVKCEKPDIIISSLYRSLIISRIVCLLLKIPLVGTFVNLRYSSQRKGMFKGFDFSKYFLTWFLDRVTSFVPDKIISNSYSIALENGKALGISRNRIKVIYRGRDSQQYKPWVKNGIEPFFKWVAIGRLIPQKGYDDLIAAVYKLKQNGYNVRFEILGDGPLRDMMQEKIIQLGLDNEISLRGNIPFAWKELYNCNAFVLTSHSEGFSGALVEAMMTGIPIVASDLPMNLEAISPGKLAYIYQTGNVEDLALKMESLMNNYNKACEIGMITRLRAIENYDIRNIATNYELTIKDVIRLKNK